MIQNKVIGVTGITGSGTSTVCKMLSEFGGIVISADKLAHEVMLKKGAAYSDIVHEFGNTILDHNLEINRKKLGELVFSDSNMLRKLEGIIHPHVISQVKAQIDKNILTIDFLGNSFKRMKMLPNSETFSCAFLGFRGSLIIDAPLLIESGLHKLCDTVLLVIAPDELRIARIISRDNIDKDMAVKRLGSRCEDSMLQQFATHVINNDGCEEHLRKQVIDFFVRHNESNEGHRR